MEEERRIKRLSQRQRRILRHYWMLEVFVAIVIGVGLSLAATLLTQVTPVVAAASLKSTSCPSPTALTANKSYFVAGIYQQVRFTCTADGMAYSTSGGIVGTPTFTLPTGASALYSYRSTTTAGTNCTAGTGTWQMTSGGAHTFPSGGAIGWDYCIVIPASASADIASFNVVWSG